MNDVSAYELISAYFDGELSGDARAEAERLLVEHAEYRRWFQQLKTLRGALAALPKYQLEHDFAQKVLRRAELATLQGTGNIPPSGAAAPPSGQPTSAQPASAPPNSTAPDSAERNGGNSGPAGGGRVSARWDAPLWIALAASVCIYVSLAGRSQVEQVESHVAQAPEAMSQSGVSEMPPAPDSAPAADEAHFGIVGDDKAASPRFHPSGPTANERTGTFAVRGKQDQEATLRDANGATRDSFEGSLAPAARVENARPDRQAAHGDANDPRTNRLMPKSAGRPVAGDEVVGSEPVPATASPGISGRMAAGGFSSSNAPGVPIAAPEREVRPGVASEAQPGADDIVICETAGDAQTLIAQFESALAAESIHLAIPQAARATDADRKQHKTPQANAGNLAIPPQNLQRSLATGPAHEEVRVYVVEASSEQLARLKARLERLPRAVVRQGSVQAAESGEQAALVQAPPPASSQRTSSPEPAPTSNPAQQPTPKLELKATPPADDASSAQGASRELGPAREQHISEATPTSQAGHAPRRAVFILRAPREK